MILFVYSSNRAKNEKAVVRAHVDVCLYDLISSRRFALLHRLTRFLLLLSIISVASQCALLHFLLKPSSSILTRFRFSLLLLFPPSSSSLHSFIHLVIEQNWNDNTVGNRMKRRQIFESWRTMFARHRRHSSQSFLSLFLSFSLSSLLLYMHTRSFLKCSHTLT